MGNLAAVLNNVSLSNAELEIIMPGAFVNYDPIKKKSSKISLASRDGIIKKSKKRNAIKALYELMSLDLWYSVLGEYSQVNNLDFRAPKPIGLSESSDNPDLFMSYLNGYELQKLGSLKRTTPVIVNGQEHPLPLFPACALYLGALNAIKEREGLFHADYDRRHIIFSPIENRSIGVVDVENSRYNSLSEVQKESIASFTDLLRHASSPSDQAVLETWYNNGREGLVAPSKHLILDGILKNIRQKYQVDFDFINCKLDGKKIK